MAVIPSEALELIDQALYLPMVLTILERDRSIFEKAPFKLKQPYLTLIEETIKAVEKDLKEVKFKMKKDSIKVLKIGQNENFTQYVFYYRGYDEQRDFFKPRLRNRTEELLEYYLYKRFN